MRAMRNYGKVVLAALVGGVGLGVIARAWMRWISTEPEFSWSGTIFIIWSFAIFMVTQSVVYLLRQKFKGKRTTRIIQFCGVIFSIPIFMAASTRLRTVPRWMPSWAQNYLRKWAQCRPWLISLSDVSGCCRPQPQLPVVSGSPTKDPSRIRGLQVQFTITVCNVFSPYLQLEY